MRSLPLGDAEVTSLEIARRFARTLVDDEELTQSERLIIARGLLHHLDLVWRAIGMATSSSAVDLRSPSS